MADRYFVGNGFDNQSWTGTTGVDGLWAATSGGAATATSPGPSDNAFFDSNSRSLNVIADTTANCFNLVISGYTGKLRGPTSGPNFTRPRAMVYGNLFIADSNVLAGTSGTGDIRLMGSNGNITIQAGLPGNVSLFKDFGSGSYVIIGNLLCASFNSVEGQVTLQGNVTSNEVFFYQGNLYTNDNSITADTLSFGNGWTALPQSNLFLGNSIIRAAQAYFDNQGNLNTFGNSTLYLDGNVMGSNRQSYMYYDLSQTLQNLVLTANTSIINTAIQADTDAAGNRVTLTVDNLVLKNNNASNTRPVFQISGNTIIQRSFESQLTGNAVLMFDPNANTHVNVWSISGTTGSNITLSSSTPGSQNYLYGIGAYTSANNLAISDSYASPDNYWYAGTGSSNVSNVVGWIFAAYTGGGGGGSNATANTSVLGPVVSTQFTEIQLYDVQGSQSPGIPGDSVFTWAPPWVIPTASSSMGGETIDIKNSTFVMYGDTDYKVDSIVSYNNTFCISNADSEVIYGPDPSVPDAVEFSYSSDILNCFVTLKGYYSINSFRNNIYFRVSAMDANVYGDETTVLPAEGVYPYYSLVSFGADQRHFANNYIDYQVTVDATKVGANVSAPSTLTTEVVVRQILNNQFPLITILMMIMNTEGVDQRWFEQYPWLYPLLGYVQNPQLTYEQFPPEVWNDSVVLERERNLRLQKASVKAAYVNKYGS